MLKKYSWHILCSTMLIIIFIFSYHHLQNKEAVQRMIERTVYGDLVFLHSHINHNEQNDWKDSDLVAYRVHTLNVTNLQVNMLLDESSYSFEEVESIISNLYMEMMPYSIKLTGKEEEKLLFSQLKSYLEEAKITNDQSLEIDYDECIKRLKYFIELLRQD